MNDLLNFVWPLSFVLVALVVLRKVQDDIKPVVSGVVTGLTGDATRNAKVYAFGFIIALAASLQELARISSEFHWVYLEAAARVLQPGLVAVIAYVRAAPAQPAVNNGRSGTQAPFSGAPAQPLT